MLIGREASVDSVSTDTCAIVRIWTVHVVDTRWCLAGEICVDGTTVGTACIVHTFMSE